MHIGSIIGVVALVSVVVILKFVLTILKQKPSTFPYESAGILLSPAERSFFGVLEQALGNTYRIFCKVRLADVLSVKKGAANWQTAFNRIQSKHLDFVICNPADFSILLAIELDDQSHEKPSRQERDDFVDKALETAGVRLVRFTAKRSYSIQEIQNALTNDNATKTVESPVPTSNEPFCPNCGGKMTKRVAKSGANAGKEFWGCSIYPKCKGIVEIR